MQAEMRNTHMIRAIFNFPTNEKLILLLLQYSISTSGSSLRLLNQIFKQNPDQWDPRKIDHTVVPDWYDHPGFISTQVSQRASLTWHALKLCFFRLIFMSLRYVHVARWFFSPQDSNSDVLFAVTRRPS
jgi:hypothetical protein